MKRCILIIFLFSLNNSGYSQGYNLSVINGQDFEFIDNAIIVNHSLWGYDVYSIPIGFNLLFFNNYIDTLFVYENHPWMLTSLNLENTQAINPFGTTLIDRGEGTPFSQSRISYKIINEPGNRINIIEWKNFGFEGDYWCHNASIDFVNFQIWLYELDNKIEFHYGPQQVTNFQCSFWGESGPFVSLIPWFNFEEDLMSDSTLWLSGLFNSPMLNMSADPGYLNGTIEAGTIYAFCNVLTNANELITKKCKIFPNPVTDIANFLIADNNNWCYIEIYESNGILEMKNIFNLVDGHTFVSLNNITSGLKLVKIYTVDKTFTSKFIKF